MSLLSNNLFYVLLLPWVWAIFIMHNMAEREKKKLCIESHWGDRVNFIGLDQGFLSKSIFSSIVDVQSDLESCGMTTTSFFAVADQGPLRHSGRSTPTMGPRSLKVIGNWHEWPSLYRGRSASTAAALEHRLYYDKNQRLYSKLCVVSRQNYSRAREK